jgi:HD superfamily phosphohydrolase
VGHPTHRGRTGRAHHRMRSRQPRYQVAPRERVLQQLVYERSCRQHGDGNTAYGRERRADSPTEEIVGLAVEVQEGDPPLPVWTDVLHEIITSRIFGADRVNYLLRGSHHAGVAYGRFDHHRPINTLMFVPRPAARAS